MPAEDLKSLVEIQAAHIDGTMNFVKRNKKLHCFKNTPIYGNICRVLSNVRYLSEDVNIPNLDAVLFLSSKKSKVEIVQAVGRAPRIARDKKPPSTDDNDDSEDSRQIFLSELLNWHDLRDKIYARIVEHFGNRLVLGAKSCRYRRTPHESNQQINFR